MDPNPPLQQPPQASSPKQDIPPESQIPSPAGKPKRNVVSIILLCVFILCASFIGGFFLSKNMYISNIQQAPTPTLETQKEETATSDWNTYTDEQLGFQIQYPNDITLNADTKNSRAVVLHIRTKDLAQYEDEPLGFDLTTALADKKALENGNYGTRAFGTNYPNSQNVIPIQSLSGKTYLSLQLIEVCDVRFTRGLIFFKNNHQVILTLTAPRSYADAMPQYFTTDTENCSDALIWKSPEVFVKDLFSQKAPQLAQDWFDRFDSIISTIQFFDTSPAPESAPASCARAGERAISNFDMTTGKTNPTIKAMDCCVGLTKIADKQSTPDLSQICREQMGVPHTLCSPCGNNICDAQYEDACNCPKDCQ